MTLTDEVCRASLAQDTSLAIDIRFPTPRRTPLHVPVPFIPPTPFAPCAFGGLSDSKLGVNALLPSDIGGDGGV